MRDAAANALHLKLEPTFAGATAPSDLPDMESIAARWERYLGEQDLTGFDRDRIKRLGDTYLAKAVEEAV